MEISLKFSNPSFNSETDQEKLFSISKICIWDRFQGKTGIYHTIVGLCRERINKFSNFNTQPVVSEKHRNELNSIN